MAAAIAMPRHSHEFMDALSPDDFDTASIRSAAPSYKSVAPSTHYTVPHRASLPPYTAPERSAAAAASGRHRASASMNTSARRAHSGPNFALPSSVLSSGVSRRGEVPNLAEFRIPSWSSISSNPNARLYHSVALRRVAAAEHASAAAEIGGLMRRLAVLERFEQEEAAAARRNAASSARAANSSNNTPGPEREPIRHLEDPHLVGEIAARRARAARIARESPMAGEDTLIHEDRRWDWFLGSFSRPSNLSSTRSSTISSSSGYRSNRSNASTRRHLRLYHNFLSH